LKTGWNTLGITSTGINVLFWILIVVIGPSLFGEIEVDLLTLYGAYLTGINVLPSITTGWTGVPEWGTKCSPLISITCFGAGTNLSYWVVGITFYGIYVILPTLIESILPSLVGVIVFVIVCSGVGSFTGTYVL
jgi:hypothetical protein